MMNLGKKLKMLRSNLFYSQIKVAKMLNINNKTLSDYERNVSQPDLETLKQLAKLYNVSIDFLLDNETNQAMDEYQFNIINKTKELPDQQKKDILNIVDVLSGNRNYNKTNYKSTLHEEVYKNIELLNDKHLQELNGYINGLLFRQQQNEERKIAK